jgi:menaquinone-9 beta-reductase
MQQIDVAVIGAGPAGSVAAYQLASAGLQVALIDQSTFPRDKVCGDGVTGDGLKVLERMGLGDWLSDFQTYDALRMTAPDTSVLDVDIPTPEGECYGRTIPRRILDSILVQTAETAGAKLMESARVEHVNQDAAGLEIITGRGALKTRMAILADGSNAPTTTRMGLTKTTPDMVAFRQYLTADTGPVNRLEVHFQKTIVPGYNWIFPLSEGRVNVGTCTTVAHTRTGQVELKSELNRFLTDPGVSDGRLLKCEAVSLAKGGVLRTQMEATRSHTDRVLVIGDAAGLVNPLSGEGISPAMLSGEIAARHTLKAFEKGDFSANQLESYTRSLRAHFLNDHQVARSLSAILRRPQLFNRVIHNLQRKPDLALLIGLIFIGQKPPLEALKPTTLWRLIF